MLGVSCSLSREASCPAPTATVGPRKTVCSPPSVQLTRWRQKEVEEAAATQGIGASASALMPNGGLHVDGSVWIGLVQIPLPLQDMTDEDLPSVGTRENQELLSMQQDVEDCAMQVEPWETFQVSLSSGETSQLRDPRPCMIRHAPGVGQPEDDAGHVANQMACTQGSPTNGVDADPPEEELGHASDPRPCSTVPMQAAAGNEFHVDVGTFCAGVRQPLSPILPRPSNRTAAQTCRQARKKPRLDATPRRSARIAKHAATKPQQVLIRKLCLAHEGEAISEGALRMYVDLCSRPLSGAHIAAVLALFGWESPQEPWIEGPIVA
ncbi:hypothetical protein CFC21_048289 [Triticum aestivum]|uniref:Uncharacterized protein n=2 Tax=Triticum aestivum TaxID=4565 RepID=A0A9R1K250_WHEAT|nr:hypothetical protein CFC21_048289 [Triticum aestivum]